MTGQNCAGEIVEGLIRDVEVLGNADYRRYRGSWSTNYGRAWQKVDSMFPKAWSERQFVH